MILRILPALALALTAATAAAEPGRYQLFTGDYLVNDYVNGGQVYARTTFKIDTATGEVWSAEGTRDASGAVRVYWAPTRQFKPLSTPQDFFDEFQRWADQPMGYYR